MNTVCKVYIVFLFLITSLFLSPKRIEASDKFVTLVNPVRISSYTVDPVQSLKAQIAVVSNFNFPATWLLTYDAFQVSGVVNEMSHISENNEIGIFFEISEALAREAHVTYTKPEHWYHPNALFLSGYSQPDRIKLIDTVFSSFKKTFGFYPSSVGAWWIDSFSLSYMHDTYGVTANLSCSDQFSTDNYQLWGQYWGSPFYPSKKHAGMPSTENNKIDVVTMQWAYRDPLNGYDSSLFSTQDYFTTDKKLDTTYFEKLLKTYLYQQDNVFGQIVVGLESDFAPEVYSQEYSRQLTVVAALQKDGVLVGSMKEFSQWYKSHFKNTPAMHFVSPDLLGGEEIVEWYENAKFRIGVRYSPHKNGVTIFDWKVYPENFVEPYFESPNRNNHLAIVVPSIIDEHMNRAMTWEIPISRDQLLFQSEGILISKGVAVPPFITSSKLLQVHANKSQVEMVISNWPYEQFGKLVRAITPEAASLFGSSKVKVLTLMIFLALLFYVRFGSRVHFVLFILGLCVLGGYLKFTRLYLVSPGELQGLLALRSLPTGTVLVPDMDCLQCEYHSAVKPVVFTNNRGYVSEMSGKNSISNKSIFSASRENIKKQFSESGARYVYLTQIENYHEVLPFSPGDMGVKKVFGNANVEIWEKE